MGEWVATTLGKFVVLQRGHDLTESERRLGTIPIMGSAGHNGYHDTALAKGPGIVIGRSGASFGQVHLSESDYWPHNTCLYVTNFLGNDPYFAYYLLKSIDFSRYNSGSAQPSLNRNLIYPIDLAIPEVPEQREIGRLLRSLDGKIELNRRLNETLEAMARALFKDWFIDFGPVRAKMEGRQPPGLSQEIAALFPDKLDDEGKPEGWKEKRLSDLIRLNPEESLKKGVVSAYLDMASLPTVGSWPDPPVRRPFGSGMRFRNGDTLLARITPCLENGKTAFVQRLAKDEIGWGSTEYIVMRGEGAIPSPYCYLLARDKAFRAYAIRSMTGTSGRQRVQTDSIANYPLQDPSTEIWNAFGSLVIPWFEAIKSHAEQSEVLAGWRDLLLPKLLSGELPVALAGEGSGG